MPDISHRLLEGRKTLLLVHSGSNVDRYRPAAFVDAVSCGAIDPETLVSSDGGRSWDAAATVAMTVSAETTASRARLRGPYSRVALVLCALAPLVAIAIDVVR